MAFNKNKVMDAARKYVEKGQLDRAIKEYLRVVKDDPKDVRVWLKIGDLYAKKGAKAEATETYLKVARFYGEQGFYLKAVAVYKQILKLDPRLVEVNLKLAELYRQLGLMSDAMQHFEMVAAHFHREGKTKEALATVRQLVDLDPENVATRIKLAELYSKEGMVDEAVTEFTAACEYLRAHNRQDDFIKVAERLLWHKPDNHALNRELATLYLRNSDPRRALQKLQACFKADPRDVETLALLAQAFQALDQKSKTVSVLKELARVLDEQGDTARAHDVHRKILMYVPDDPDSRAYVGATDSVGAVGSSAEPRPDDRLSITASDVPSRQSVRGNPTGSLPLVDDSEHPPMPQFSEPEPVEEEDFVADLSMDEESSFDTGSVAGEVHAEEIVKILTETDVYVKYGLHQKAVDHLKRVFDLDPDNVEARERLKDIYMAQGREADALDELMRLAEQAASTDPERAEFYLREVLGIDGTYGPAFELARRFQLEMTGAPEVEIVDDLSEDIELVAEDVGTGQVAPVEDDIDFDDIDFGDSDVIASSEPASGEFEFDLDDVVEPPPEDRSEITMEVQADQVEEMVELGDDAEELDFDEALIEELPAEEAVPPGYEALDPQAYQAPMEPVGYEAPVEPAGYEAPMEPVGYEAPVEPVGYEAPVEPVGYETPVEPAGYEAPVEPAGYEAPVEPVGYEAPVEPVGYEAPVEPGAYEAPVEQQAEAMPPDFDPEDAAAFDAEVARAKSDPLSPEPVSPEMVDPHSFDAEPIADVSDYEMPVAGDPYPSQPGSDFAEGGATEYMSPDVLAERIDASVDDVSPPDFAPGAGDPAFEDGAVDADYDLLGDTGGTTAEEPGPADAGTSLEDDLDEADFFVSQGLYSEARDILESLLGRYPDHPLVTAKLHDIQAMEEAQGPRAPTEAPTPETGETRQTGAEPKPTVLLEKPVDEEDADTHYDLGLAYKEMGLYDEAIKSFQKVINVPGREVQVHLMVGLCQREQGNLSEAINQFKSGLHVESISEPEKLSLYYEIASCYEALGDPREALYYYEMVYKKDAEYRDVADRVEALHSGNQDGGRSKPEDTADAAIDSLLAESGD